MCVPCVFDFWPLYCCGVVVVVILFISPNHFARLFYDYRRDGVRRGGTKTSRYYIFSGGFFVLFFSTPWTAVYSYNLLQAPFVPLPCLEGCGGATNKNSMAAGPVVYAVVVSISSLCLTR